MLNRCRIDRKDIMRVECRLDVSAMYFGDRLGALAGMSADRWQDGGRLMARTQRVTFESKM